MGREAIVILLLKSGKALLIVETYRPNVSDMLFARVTGNDG